MGELIDFTKGINRYRKLAEARSEKEDFSGALAFLFSAKSMQENYLLKIPKRKYGHFYQKTYEDMP